MASSNNIKYWLIVWPLLVLIPKINTQTDPILQRNTRDVFGVPNLWGKASMDFVLFIILLY